MTQSHAGGRHGVSNAVSLPPFQALVDRHAAELHRFLAASIGPDLADDCLQDTFIAALRAYPRLRHGENLRAWLYTIAHHKATDAVRRAVRRPSSTRLDGLPAGREPSEPAHEPADDGLWLRVRSLPGKQRAAVVHRFVMDLDYRSIGDLMGITEEAARQNVSAGLKRLREELDT
jgi:RNA polymerase sigma factor (sigma-70 family)